MFLRSIIPSQILRISVLAGYLCAIVIGSGLHIHVEAAEMQEHSHGSSGNEHAHETPNVNAVQHDAADVHDARHNHPIAEFSFTATRVKDGSEIVLHAKGAFIAIRLSVEGSLSRLTEQPLYIEREISIPTSEFFKLLPARAPPLT